MLLHRRVGASHVVHQDHSVRDLVQVHAHCCPDEEADADAAAGARLGYFEVPAQVGGDELRSVWYPVRSNRTNMIRSLQEEHLRSIVRIIV